MASVLVHKYHDWHVVIKYHQYQITFIVISLKFCQFSNKILYEITIQIVRQYAMNGLKLSQKWI